MLQAITDKKKDLVYVNDILDQTNSKNRQYVSWLYSEINRLETENKERYQAVIKELYKELVECFDIKSLAFRVDGYLNKVYTSTH